MALLSEMRWQNKNSDTTTYGIGGLSVILSEMQIHLCDTLTWRLSVCVLTVGKNTTAIKEYMAKQSEEDKLGEQLRIDYPESPFK